MEAIVIHDNRYRQQHCYSGRQRGVPVSVIFGMMSDVSDKLFLTQWRRAKGLSQEALAHQIGYSRSAIAAAETRHYNATLAFLVAYAQGVGAPSVGALFSHPDSIDLLAHELTTAFNKIQDQSDRMTVLHVAKSLSAKSDDEDAAEGVA